MTNFEYINLHNKLVEKLKYVNSYFHLDSEIVNSAHDILALVGIHNYE